MTARIRPSLSIMLSGLLVLSACGKNDGSASSNTSSNNSTPSSAAASTSTTGGSTTVAPTTATANAPPASVFNVPAQESLSVSDVQTIISRAVAEASVRRIEHLENKLVQKNEVIAELMEENVRAKKANGEL